MLIVVVKEELLDLISDEIEYWSMACGKPNLDAFDFNPKEVDHQQLIKLGYYNNREAWIAGVRIKALKKYLAQLTLIEQHTVKTKNL